jgi:hypothetical protein
LFHESINITGNNLLCASKRTALQKLAKHVYKSERTELQKLSVYVYNNKGTALQKLATYDFPECRFPEHFSSNISKDM